jgi:hypothetical protein
MLLSLAYRHAEKLLRDINKIIKALKLLLSNKDIRDFIVHQSLGPIGRYSIKTPISITHLLCRNPYGLSYG